MPWLIGPLANERAFIGAIAQPIVGRISDRTRTPIGRRKPFFLIGVPLMSLSLFLLAGHPNVVMLLTLMTIGSFFLAVAQDPYLALIADLFPEQHRGKVGGFLGLTTALGNIAFALIASFLWGSNETLVFGLVIIALVVSFAFTFLTVKEPPAPPRTAEEKRQKFDLKLYLQELRNYPEAGKYIGSLSLFWIGAGGATPFVTLFGTEALHASESAAFLLPIAFVAMSAIFSIPAGLLADRIGKKQVMFMGLMTYGLGALIGSRVPKSVSGGYCTRCHWPRQRGYRTPQSVTHRPHTAHSYSRAAGHWIGSLVVRPASWLYAGRHSCLPGYHCVWRERRIPLGLHLRRRHDRACRPQPSLCPP